MSLTMRDKGGGDYERVPPGTHIAICYGLVDVGLQEGNFGIKPKVVVLWELPHEKMQDGRPFGVSKMYTASLNEKANLRKDLESWRSRGFTPEELDGFDLRAILGKPCQVTIIEETKGEKTYSNVASVTAMPRGMQAPERHNDLISYDMDKPDRAAYERLPEWIRKKIDTAKSPNQQEGYGYEYRGDPPSQDIEDDIPF